MSGGVVRRMRLDSGGGQTAGNQTVGASDADRWEISKVHRRSRIARICWYSSGFNPSSANGCAVSGVLAACSTVSVTAHRPGSAGHW